jgi:16S rRNA processing protein RimM
VADILTDFPERLVDGVRFGVGEGDQPEEFFETYRVRTHKGKWLISVIGIRDRETVDQLRGRYILLPEQSLDELPEGYYYEHHVTGLECRSEEGKVFGTVAGLDPGVGQTRLIVRSGRREFLVPYVPEIVREVDLDRGIIIIDPPAGLFDDDFETA